VVAASASGEPDKFVELPMRERRRGAEREIKKRDLATPSALAQSIFASPLLMNVGPLMHNWLYPLGTDASRLRPRGPSLSAPTSYVDLRLLDQQLRAAADAAPEAVLQPLTCIRVISVAWLARGLRFC
jgi:hypothetical protein